MKYHDWTEQQFIKSGHQLQQWKDIINKIQLLLSLLLYLIKYLSLVVVG